MPITPYLQGHPQNHTYSSESWNWLSQPCVNPVNQLTTRWNYLKNNPDGEPLAWNTAMLWMDIAVGGRNSSNPYLPPGDQSHYIEIDSNDHDGYVDTWLNYEDDPHGYSFIVRGLASALHRFQNNAEPLAVWRYKVRYEGHSYAPGVLSVRRLA